jgi:hypothetical protein
MAALGIVVFKHHLIMCREVRSENYVHILKGVDRTSEAAIFPFITVSIRLQGSSSTLCGGYWLMFALGHGVKLTTDLHIVPSLTMHETVHPPSYTP